MAKILIIEDDMELAVAVVDLLSMEAHVVEHAATGEDGLQLLSGFTYDLLILDWKLPGLDGLSVLKEARRAGHELPILFLTAESAVESLETGLNAGADDYLAKPFKSRELSARVRSLLRRPQSLLTSTLKASYMTIELESRVVVIDEKRISLTPKEFALLEFLVRHPNKHFSSSALLAAIWPSDTESSDDSVRAVMFQLRKKIAPQGKICPIRTVQGSGYILDGKAGDS